MKHWLPFLLLAGCVMKNQILETPLVSQTYSTLPTGAHLQLMGPAYGHYCANGDDTTGMMDEAILSAQRRGSFDFISDAKFYREANCVSLQGLGQRLVQSTPEPAPLNKTQRNHKSH